MPTGNPVGRPSYASMEQEMDRYPLSVGSGYWGDPYGHSMNRVKGMSKSIESFDENPRYVRGRKYPIRR